MNLTNYFDHPGDNRYIVFQFALEDHADHFENLLKEADVIYERHWDEEVEKTLFGINKRYRKEASRCNFLTHAAYRKPFIGNAWFKWSILLVTAGILILGIIGYLKSIQWL